MKGCDVIYARLIRCFFHFSVHPVNKKPAATSINRSESCKESYKEPAHKVSELQYMDIRTPVTGIPPLTLQRGGI